jgi:hypothetical protein
MKSILSLIFKNLNNKLFDVIILLCNVIKSFFQYKTSVIKQKEREEEEKKTAEFNKKADEVVDNGTIDDLLDLKRK